VSTSGKGLSGEKPPGASPDTSAELHGFVCEIARRAGELQLSRYDRPGEIKEKAPKDLVTEVDLLAERLLISSIEERYPQDAILSEERGGGFSDSGRTWLLDPVDGTANYSRSNPLFCACISVMEGGAVTHAAVAAPRLGDLYHARLGGGAYRDAGGESFRLAVSGTRKLEDAFVGADISFLGAVHGNDARKVDEVFTSAWQLRALGSAGVRGAWLAAGYLDVSLGTRNTVWDYAPTVLLVNEAGGSATDLSGEPWTRDSDGLLATNGHLHDEVLEILHST
jgi:myo-inositol-1(or 4)-monophosphatase